jgi:phytoene desaturase
VSGGGPTAAVIGSGFGGLAAAIRLQTAGIQTTLFEGRDQPGGRASVSVRDGHTFDMGPTVITAPTSLAELFELAGEQLADHVELMPVAPLYRLVWPDGDRFDYVNDDDEFLRQVAARDPRDRVGYLRFREYSRAVFEAGYEVLAAVPFLHFSDMVRAGPTLIKRRADRSVYSVVRRYIHDEHLRQALSFHSLLVGGNPFETSAIYALIHHLERRWGVSFPRGGTGALVQALAGLFVRAGGVLRLGTPVLSLQTSTARIQAVVHRSGGEEVAERFDAVVSNADVHHTYAKLLGGHPRGVRRGRQLARAQWSMSLFVLYFATDRDYAEAAVHHTVVFGPRYRELLREIFHGAELPEDFSLYLHAPHITDPSMAPAGKGTFYALAPVPHLGNAPLDWTAIAAGYAERILHALEEVLPNLRSHVLFRFWMAPPDFESELGAFQGNAFSLSPRLTQSAWFRVHNRDKHIRNLYFAGAGTHPGAGIPGVVNSAKATAGLVVADLERNS